MILWDALTSYMILGVGAAGSTNIGEKSRDVNYSRPWSQNRSGRRPNSTTSWVHGSLGR